MPLGTTSEVLLPTWRTSRSRLTSQTSLSSQKCNLIFALICPSVRFYFYFTLKFSIEGFLKVEWMFVFKKYERLRNIIAWEIFCFCIYIFGSGLALFAVVCSEETWGKGVEVSGRYLVYMCIDCLHIFVLIFCIYLYIFYIVF